MPPQKLPALSHARLIRVCCKDGYPLLWLRAETTALVTDIKRECLSGSRRGLPCLGFKTPTMVGPVPENAESRRDRSLR